LIADTIQETMTLQYIFSNLTFSGWWIDDFVCCM